jgi:hypothetical protein
MNYLRYTLLYLSVFVCLGSAFVSYRTTEDNNITVVNTFNSMRMQAARANQIAIAQDYAMQLANIAEYEASRARELESQFNQLGQKYIDMMSEVAKAAEQMKMSAITISAQAIYLEQLQEFIQEHDYDVPAPDMSRMGEDFMQLQPVHDYEVQLPTNPEDAAPVEDDLVPAPPCND